MKLENLNKGQVAFIDQLVRKLLVGWCTRAVTNETLYPFEFTDEDNVFIDYAQKKGFVSADKTRILAKGWQAAASFLKR